MVFTFYFCEAQSNELSISEQLDIMEMEMDSLSIFNLIDSLLKRTSPIYSELNFRVGYNSSVLSAGRNFGINQFGLSPGVSYYHKKGFYADVSGFWNSSLDPKYNLTVLSAGYMKFIGKHWTLNGSYERWVYQVSDSETSTSSLKNSLNISSGLTTKHLYGSLDYSYLFGQSNAHRIIGNISGNISVKNIWIFDQIRFAPGISAIYGNSDVTTYFNGNIIEEIRTNEYLKSNINTPEFISFARNALSADEMAEIENIRMSNIRFKGQQIIDIYLNNPTISNHIYELLDETENQYGLMNYSFQLPVILTLNKSFNLILSYSYSVPVKLPGETSIFLDPIGYFSCSFIYRIPIR
ncbi:MAG: hypothetical protein ACJA08_000679 [Cyclobacteriaceae bacterium]